MDRANRRRFRTGAAVASTVALAVPLLVLGATPASAQAAGGFVATSALPTARSHATATLLAGGEVLVAGGQDASGNPLGSAELYNPATASWAPAALMPVAVTDATATLLNNGEVLVAGGLTGSANALVPTAASQLFDPTTGQWSLTGALPQATFDASAALSASGEVLYAGGLPSTSPTASAVPVAELYDPTTGNWTPLRAAMPAPVNAAAYSAVSQ